MKPGAFFKDGQTSFCVWAPQQSALQLIMTDPARQALDMSKDAKGYWTVTVDQLEPGSRYFYKLDDGSERPDPAAFYQPDGVHKASAVVNHQRFSWLDQTWQGISLSEMIIYELHVGTFTPQGTFRSVIDKLDYLKDLGVNTIEIMPVAQFPGARNWGYDGVHPYAVQNTYGGPDGLKELVNACHLKQIAVILDVVYNHLGPEGNYLGQFGPYFTGRYRTPWGSAINYDGPHCDGVRDYFINNALYWYENFHMDGLRLDAIHGIYDFGARHFLAELADSVEQNVHRRGIPFHLIAESDLNDIRIVLSKDKGGCALDAQWLDDFHHSLRTILTQEKTGYYQDFGRFEQFARALKEGFVYAWDYSPYRQKTYGSSSRDIPPHQFVVFIQNHDQVGNRMLGERLSQLISFEGLKCAAGALILSPYIPMLFMGEELAQEKPFLYFISHLDPHLVQAVQEGRKKEFAAFQWQGEPPDPQAEETFLQSKIEWDKMDQGIHFKMRCFYKELIRLRKTIPALCYLHREGLSVDAIASKSLIIVSRKHKESQVLMVMNLSGADQSWQASGLTHGWVKILDSAEERWDGPGNSCPDRIEPDQTIQICPFSIVLYEGEN